MVLASTLSLFLVYSVLFLASLSARPAVESVTLSTVGDVMLGREVNVKSLRQKDYTHPFAHVSDFLSQSDLVLINLESPIVPACPPTSEGMIFCSPPESLQGLKKANVSLANLANNHTLNYGRQGLTTTQELLTSQAISPLGLGPPVIRQIKNTTIGFLGYTAVGSPQTGLAWATVDRLTDDLANLAPQVDFIVVSFHWGLEYTSVPTSHQITLAHHAIDQGADVVVGHHPHWIQSLESYRGKPIVYSLGNFVFDQLWSQPTREGLIANFVFTLPDKVEYKLFPITINTSFQPELK